MGIWLILTIWILLAAVLVLAICAAAARPIPRAVTTGVERRRSLGRATETQTRPCASKVCCLMVLAIVIALVTTSCATTSGNWSPEYPEKGSAKGGASLLMRR